MNFTHVLSFELFVVLVFIRCTPRPTHALGLTLAKISYASPTYLANSILLLISDPTVPSPNTSTDNHESEKVKSENFEGDLGGKSHCPLILFVALKCTSSRTFALEWTSFHFVGTGLHAKIQSPKFIG